MRLATKFSLYTAIIFILLVVTGAIALLFGMPEPTTEISHSVEAHSSLGKLHVAWEILINNHTLMAKFIFYIISVTGFGIILLMMLNLRRLLLRPLLKAVDFALKLAENQFPPKIDKPAGNNEITELIDSLNFMRDRLQSTFIKLQTSHENERDARCSAELQNQMKSGFINSAISDFNSDIDVIDNYMEILRKKSCHNKEDITVFSGLQKELASLKRRIAQLALLNSLDSFEKEKVEPQKIKSADFLGEVVRLNAALFEIRHVRIEEEYHSSMPPQITTDPEILKSLLSTVILTFANNSEDGEALKCSCFCHDNIISFSVRDTKQTKPRQPLFEQYEKFSCGEQDIAEAEKTLIPLIVMNEWIRILDGRMVLINDNPNSNLEVQFQFNEWDMVDHDIAQNTFSRRLSIIPAADLADDDFTPSPAKILTACSNHAYGSTVKKLLELDQHKVHSASNIKNLLHAAATENFDLIIIALYITKDSLRDIVRTIHDCELNAKTPIMLITSEPDSLRCDMLKPGEIKYILKRPVNFSELRLIAGRCNSGVDPF